jgi:hypothetical protein
METFVQLDIAEFERLKKFEELVKTNIVFTEYDHGDHNSVYAGFNAPETVKDLTTKLNRIIREKDDTIRSLRNNIRDLEHKIISMNSRTFWQRVINKWI